MKMHNFVLLFFGVLGLFFSTSGITSDERPQVIVLAHPETPSMDSATVQRVFLGKVVQVEGKTLTPVNLKLGQKERDLFMRHILQHDDEKFVGYWTVRRYIGRGVPPREVRTPEEMLDYLAATPGAIGYASAQTELINDLKIILTWP